MTLEGLTPKNDGQDRLKIAYQNYLLGNGVSLPGNAPLLSDDLDSETKLSFEAWKLLRQFVAKPTEKSEKNSL